jgi:hypothetical protein
MHWHHPDHIHNPRPHIGCTFSSMRRCDATFGPGTDAADACREGARDAHLLDFAFGRGEAYHAGRAFTMACPPQWAVGDPYHHHHFDSCTDPRVCWR